MAESGIELRAEVVRDRKVLWIEFSVIVFFVYAVGIVLQWMPIGVISTISDPPLRLAQELSKLLPILFIVAVADGTLGTLGLKRPVWRVDFLVVIGLCAFLYLASRLPWWIFTWQQIVEWAGVFNTNHLRSEWSNGATFFAVIPGTIVSCMFQEVFSRGYVIGRLRELVGGTWMPLIASTCIFGAWHFYQGPIGLARTLATGLVFGYVYMRTGRLWPMIVAHTINNLYFEFLSYNAHLQFTHH